ncbi:MAG: hypothetical protein LC745_09620, partial [Planctomycetia bacterium]|nr:hypothetical protein [Planctomycetia bacterium]
AREKKPAGEAPAPPAEDPGVVAAGAVVAPPLDMSGGRAGSVPDGTAAGSPGDASVTPVKPAPPADAPALGQPRKGSSEFLRGTADTKQKARWLLHQARERIQLKQFDAAAQIVAEVRDLGVTWGYFDDTPDKVTESITKARARAGPSGAETPPPRDRRSARARLREARAALAANDVDGADAVVRDARSRGLRYGLLEDTPDKVAAAVEEARRRARP